MISRREGELLIEILRRGSGAEVFLVELDANTLVKYAVVLEELQRHGNHLGSPYLGTMNRAQGAAKYGAVDFNIW